MPNINSLDTTIKKVSVYRSMALIERRGSLKLDSTSESRVTIADLPLKLVDSSLRAQIADSEGTVTD